MLTACPTKITVIHDQKSYNNKTRNLIKNTLHNYMGNLCRIFVAPTYPAVMLSKRSLPRRLHYTAMEIAFLISNWQ